MPNFGLSFASNYWHRNEGIDFTQTSLGDPAVQIEHKRRRNRHTIKKWDHLGVPVDDNARKGVDNVDPVVNGYGVATVPMMLGCEGVFTDELDPYAKPLELDDEAVMALTPETDFSANPVMQDLEQQAAWLVNKYGKARIAINMQSVPNIAFKLRGDQLMFDFYENPEVVHKLVDYLQQTWVNIRTYISKVNDRNGYPDRGGMVSLDNCTVALISPDIYREFFLPYDIKTAKHYGDRYGVHHCGANMHLFAQDYAKLGEGIWFDIGYGSEVADCMDKLKTGETIPRWGVRFGPARLRSADAGEIREERKKFETCGANSVACVGTDPDTPEENLKAFLLP